MSRQPSVTSVGRRTVLRTTALAGIVGVLGTGSAAASGGLGQGLVGRYQLNTLHRGTGRDGERDVVKDTSPNDNDGTWSDPDDDPAVDGKVGNAFAFDGVDDRGLFEDGIDGLPYGSDPRTVAGWAFLTGDGSAETVFGYGSDAGQGERFVLQQRSDGLGVQFRGHFRGSPDLRTGWTHLAVVVPPGATRTDDVLVYVDGHRISESELAGGSQDLDTVDGFDPSIGHAHASDSYFEGRVDDVHLYDRALDSGEICQLYLRGLGEELAAHYPLDETSGDTATDASGSGLDGTIEGDPVLGVPGQVDTAFDFDGVDDRVSVDPFTDLSGGPVSVAIWVYPQSTPNAYSNVVSLADQFGSGRTNSVLIQHRGVDAGDPFLYAADDGTGTIVNLRSPGVGAGDWHHVALTQDGSQLRGYLDGDEVASSPVAVDDYVSTPTSVARVAMNAVGGSHTAYDALVDDVRVYRRALPPKEIAGLHHCQR